MIKDLKKTIRSQGPRTAFMGALLTALVLSTATPSAWASNNVKLTNGNAGRFAAFEVAAAGKDLEETTPPAQSSASTNIVRRVQQGLADQGFYFGPIDGRYGPQTEAAIKAYQKSADLKVDGQATPQLASDLETGGQIGQLLGRLEKSRGSTIEAARDALLANPQTRNLVEGIGSENRGAKIDTKACMANPEPRCLLLEAVQSARDIDKPEMRDWALGEILTAQARAGLAQDAALTTRRIHDPRLIMVALRDIAKARAEVGQIDEALAAVDIIPDPVQQAEAYVSIAETQSQFSDTFNAAQTSKNLDPYLKRIESVVSQISFRARMSVILYKAGFGPEALAHIEASQKQLDQITDPQNVNKARRHIAAAYAEIGMAQQALDVLKTVKSGADDTPVLIAAANGLAQAGDADAALVTADSIEEVRYRALVLARIASYQGGAGQFTQAKETLEKAKTAAKTIKFPFAKAYAYSRIALAFNDVSISMDNDSALLEEAFGSTHLIQDDRLKAHIFWTIADERRRGGDLAGATRAQDFANTATDEISSPFTRVWMLCDIAEDRANRKETDAAWSIFNVALDEAKTITSPWGRARALSKVAGTMTSLADHAAQTPVKH